MVIEYKDAGKHYAIFVENGLLKNRTYVMRTNEDEKVGVLLEHKVTASTPKEIMRYWLSYRLSSWLRELKRNVFKKGRK